MIQGINPLHITEIKWTPFKRVGHHPLTYRLRRKKFGFMRIPAGLIWQTSVYWDDFVWPATVEIVGQHKTIKSIECRSNQRAQELCAELNRQLASYINELSTLDRLSRAI
jgi:hypothetical protein